MNANILKDLHAFTERTKFATAVTNKAKTIFYNCMCYQKAHNLLLISKALKILKKFTQEMLTTYFHAYPTISKLAENVLFHAE